MRRLLLLPIAIASAAFLTPATFAQSVVTEAVGFSTQDCQANTDTFISLPFTRPPEFVGAVQGVSGNVITISGTPFQDDQFVYAAGTQPKTYFVLVGPHASSNPKEGHLYTVIDNTSNTITVDLGSPTDPLTGIQPQTQVSVIPYHTLGSVFPASDANVSFTPSANPAVKQTEILIPNYAGTGVNLSHNVSYFYQNGAWRKFGESGLPNRSDDPFVNGGYFLLRNRANATKLTHLGSVLYKKTSIPLATRSGSATSAAARQDNFVGFIRPVGVTLNDLGLISSGAFRSSANSALLVDQLLVFNNAAAGTNKSAAATYFYSNNAWRKFGEQGLPDRGGDVIPAGSGFWIRKGGTASGEDVFWMNAPTYTNTP